MSQMIILHKRSQTPGVIPSLSSLQEGELGMNTADSKLFIKSSFGEVRSFISAEQQPYTLLPDLSSTQPLRGNNQVASLFSTVVGGYNNVITAVADNGAILGGNNNFLSHPNSFILGSGLSSQAPNYTFVENLSCPGTINSNKICTNFIGTEFASEEESTAALTVAPSAVGINVETPTAPLDINGNVMRIRQSKVPSSSNASGNSGDICWGATHVYVCVAANTWKRLSYDNSNNW